MGAHEADAEQGTPDAQHVGGTSPSPDDASEERLDPRLDDQITRKIDRRLVPVLLVMFMLAYLDRSNLGNAKIQGLEAELHMAGSDYNVASTVFYVSYIVFEVPSNLVLSKLAPSTWLSALLFGWGVSAMCQGLTSSFAGLVACRFFIGLFEAGFTPGCLFLFSMYYTRFQLQRRLTILLASGIVAGAFSGLLAYGLAKMDGLGGYSAWRWIFIIEGLATIVFSGCAKFLIVDWPTHATFLSPAEQSRLQSRISQDNARGIARMDRFDRPALKRIVLDWKIGVSALMYLGAVNTGYVIALFLPTILLELGYTASSAQIHSIPVYLVAAVAMVLVAVGTDKLKHRYGFVILGASVSIIGYAVLLAPSTAVSSHVRYMAVFFVAAGAHSTHPITLGWLANNVSGHYKRAVSTAIQISLGNCAGFIGSNIFVNAAAPAYTLGYAISLGLMCMTIATATAFVLGLRAENRKRDRGERDERLALPKEEVANLGDDHPSFRFTY